MTSMQQIQTDAALEAILPIPSIPDDMKRCPDCDEIKPRIRFGPKGKNPRCYDCQMRQTRAHITPEMRKEINEKIRQRNLARYAAKRAEQQPAEEQLTLAPQAAEQEQANVPTYTPHVPYYSTLKAPIDKLASLMGYKLVDGTKSSFWSILGKRASITPSTISDAYYGRSHPWSTTLGRIEQVVNEWIKEIEAAGQRDNGRIDAPSRPAPVIGGLPYATHLAVHSEAQPPHWVTAETQGPEPIAYDPDILRGDTNSRTGVPYREEGDQWRQRNAIRLLHRLQTFDLDRLSADTVALVLDLLEGDS